MAPFALVVTLAFFSPPQDAKEINEKWWSSCGSISRDGKRFALGGSYFVEKGGWAIWDTRGQRLHFGPTRGTHVTSFSPDGKWLAVGGDCNELRVINCVTGKVYWELTDAGQLAPLNAATFTPDNRFLVSAADDGMLRIWDMKDKSPHALFTFTCSLHWVRAHTEEYLRNWKRLAGNAAPGGVKMYAHFDDLVQTIYDLALTPDGKEVALALGTKTVKFLDHRNGKITRSFVTEQLVNVSVCLSRDGSLLAIGGALENPTIEVWDVNSGKRIRTLQGHTQSVLELAFSPNNKMLLSGGLADGACLWDLEGGTPIFRCHTEKKTEIAGVGFLPNGDIFYTLDCHGDTPVNFWDITNRKAIVRKKLP